MLIATDHTIARVRPILFYSLILGNIMQYKSHDGQQLSVGQQVFVIISVGSTPAVCVRTITALGQFENGLLVAKYELDEYNKTFATLNNVFIDGNKVNNEIAKRNKKIF